MPRRGHLITALAQPGFRRLFGVRLLGQFGDGIFQAGLAGAVLFSPDRQAHASDIAAGFTVLLLPYSLIGPFAGVLLDRWSRQRILVVSNLLRALAVLLVAAQIAAGFTGIAFYASALVVISLSRFFNSALSAALPHVVRPAELVTANALTTTLGGGAATLGGGAAVGVRALAGSSAHDYAAIAVTSTLPYLLSAVVALGFTRTMLGPDAGERDTAWIIARGLVAGARHVIGRPAARNALAAIGVHRLCFGIWTVTTLLLYRNYFRADGAFRSGLTGLTQIVAAAAAGGALAALVTPSVSRRMGYGLWPALQLAGAGAALVACTLPYRLPLAVLGALLLGFASQGIKICVDTLVQAHVDDEFRGRVFALYDALFNLALVVSAALTAFALPEDGHTPATAVAVGAVYVAAACWYFVAAERAGSAVSETARRTSV